MAAPVGAPIRGELPVGPPRANRLPISPRTSRESRDSLRVSLARHLPRPAAFALSVAMATTMALLGWSRSKPWPSLLVSLALAGDPVPEFSLYQLLSIPGYCAQGFLNTRCRFDCVTGPVSHVTS